jgi:hypothetical protein
MLSASLSASPAFAAFYSVRLEAERTVLRADGRSQTYLNATVVDDRGNFVLDGTRVRFTLSGSGRLDTDVAETKSGVARVALTAAEQPGICEIMANLEAAVPSTPARLRVAFTKEATNADTGTRWIRLEGDSYLAYFYGVPEPLDNGRYVLAIGKKKPASVTYQGLKVKAKKLEMETLRSIVMAQEVTLEKFKLSLSYHAARLDWGLGMGVGERFVEGKRHLYQIDLNTLQETERTVEELNNPMFLFDDLSTSAVTVVARSISIEPGRQVQLRRAQFYFLDQKGPSFPLHVMRPGQESLFPDPLLGYGPSGITFDLPLTYNATESGVGTFHLRRGASFGSSVYAIRPGWSLDMDQTYRGRKGEGRLEAMGFSRPDWTVRWRHAERIDAHTDASLYVDTPRRRDLFLYSQLARQFSGFRLNGLTTVTRIAGYKDPQGKDAIAGDKRYQLDAETNSHALNMPKIGAMGREWRYSLTAGITKQEFLGLSRTADRGVFQTQNIATRLSARPLKVTPKTTLQRNFRLGYSWVQGGGASTGKTGVTLQGTLGVQQALKNGNAVQFSYDYSHVPAINRVQLGTNPAFSTYTRPPEHRISTVLSLGNKNWSTYLSGSTGLDKVQSTLFGETRAHVYGPWSARVRIARSQANGFRFQDVETGVIRDFSGREVALYYSTLLKRFQLDLTGARF